MFSGITQLMRQRMKGESPSLWRFACSLGKINFRGAFNGKNFRFHAFSSFRFALLARSLVRFSNPIILAALQLFHLPDH